VTTALRSRLGRLNWLETGLILLFIVVLALFAWLGYGALPRQTGIPYGRGVSFDGKQAYKIVLAQMEFGPRRDTGSSAWRKTGDYIASTLQQFHWNVEVQGFEYKGVRARNIIGRAGKGPVIIVGAHYDTRRQADRDPEVSNRSQPVPGANDGASGVAVLLELARSLDPKRLDNEVWLVFFDAEDNGRLDGWDWVRGSTYMATSLTVAPEAVIVVDMVGDADQRFLFEMNSDPALSQQIWKLAESLGYGDIFLPQPGPRLIDDHLPFAQRGIPAVDIIDFDYPYWHTTEDTADKVSPTSLRRVGHVLETLLEGDSS